jgi:GNAT superfamily N-acetyltransferase
MRDVEIIRPGPEQVPELARICFEAFKGINERHGFPLDIPTLDAAGKLIGMLVSRSDYFAAAARVDGRLAGSNFMSVGDEVAGVGPISVDPALDDRGIGRCLMHAVLEHAHAIGKTQVRLLQTTYNAKSLSLYASLGFDVCAAIGVMAARPAANPDPLVRRAVPADVPMLDELCRHVFKVSRWIEIEAAFAHGFPVYLREQAGRLTAYFIPGPMGHGASNSANEILAVIGESARQSTGEIVFFCPLQLGDFFRKVLKAGHRLRKIMTYMSIGPYVSPEGIWLPSISC